MAAQWNAISDHFMNQTTKPDAMASNSFMRMLGELRGGSAVTDASAELAHVVEEVKKTGMAGELTIKLKVNPNDDGETLGIVYKIESKVPKKSKPATNFWVGNEGQLLREDPRQQEMFATVDGGALAEPEYAAPEAEAAVKY